MIAKHNHRILGADTHTLIETFVEDGNLTSQEIHQAKIKAYRFVGTTRYTIEVKITNDIVDYITKCERLTKMDCELFVMLSDTQKSED